MRRQSRQNPQTRRTRTLTLALLVLSATATGVVARLVHVDSAIAWIGIVGGVLGPPSLWLTWASYRDDRRDAASSLSLSFNLIGAVWCPSCGGLVARRLRR